MSNPYINCKVGRYHWFKVISSDNLAQHEVCKFCHLKQSYGFKSDGTMVDSQKYFMDHIRAFAQPSMGEVYYDINPGDMEKFLIVDKNKKKAEEKEEDRKDKFKFALKRAFEDKDDGIQKKI